MDVFLAIVIVVSGLLYFLFPTYYVYARRDPAVYLINGVNIAQTGSVELPSNEYIGQNYSELSSVVDLTYRGVYSDYLAGDSTNAGDVTSQFLHYFPSALAIGYSLAGLEGLVRVNAFIGVVCLLILYYFLKRTVSKRTAKIAVLFLAINPAQIWCARITQTELLYQLFWFLGIYIFLFAWNEYSIGAAFLAGAILGFAGLNRIDSYLVGAGIFAAAIYANLWLPLRKKLFNFLALGYVLAALISFAYSYFYSKYYIIDHWEAGVLSAIVIFNILLAVLTILSFLVGKIKIVSQNNFVAAICDRVGYRMAAFVVLGIVIFVAYFVRPLLQTGANADLDFNCRSLVEFCWYTSVMAIPLFLLGLWEVLGQKSLRKVLLLFNLTGASSLFVYLLKPAIAPDHIWASRRWVSVCFPFVLVIVAYGIDRIPNLFGKNATFKKWFVPVCSTFFAAFFLFQSRAFLFQSMLKGMPEQYDELASNLQDDTLYIAQQSHFALILRFVYGKNVVVMQENAQDQMWELAQNTDIPVYYIGDLSALQSSKQNSEAYCVYEGTLSGKYLVQENGKYATNTYEIQQSVDVYRLGKTDDAFWESGTQKYVVDLNRFSISETSKVVTQQPDGEWTVDDQSETELAKAIHTNINGGTEGYAVYGPGITLQPGSYRVLFTLECLNLEQCMDESLGWCDISINGGQQILSTFPITKDLFSDGQAKTLALDFSTAAGCSLSGIEFRVYANADVQFLVKEISYQLTGTQVKVLMPGTDDFRTVGSIVSMDSEYLPFYVVENEYEEGTLDLTDLEKDLSEKQHTVALITADRLSTLGNALVLIPASNVDLIQSLLPQYTILARLQNYALLAPSYSAVCSTYRDNGGRILSNGNAISLRYYAGAVSNAASSAQATIPAGTYRLDYEIQIAGASLFDPCGNLVISYGDQKNEIPLTKNLFTYDVCSGSLSENVILENNTKLSAQVTTIPEVSGAQMEIWLTPLS